MNPTDRDAIVTICVLAARADGTRDTPETAQFERIIADLGVTDLSAILARVDTSGVGEVARRLSTPEARRTAYETALAVCYADGDLNPAERAFLEGLRGDLGLAGDPEAEAAIEEARVLATAPIPGPPLPVEEAPPPGVHKSQAGLPPVTMDAAIDAMIRQHALIAGALELLPQSLASLAIIPLQLRLVHRIGADYGQKLDPQQVKVLLGVLGLGTVGQVLDGVARKALRGVGRGLLGRMLGGFAGGVAGSAAGMGLAFASTWALGHAAKQYYAQGQKLSREDLQALFLRFKAEAQEVLPRVQEEIRAQSEKLDLNRLMASLGGRTIETSG